jgi:sugar lactone lactonase YvrE
MRDGARKTLFFACMVAMAGSLLGCGGGGRNTPFVIIPTLAPTVKPTSTATPAGHTPIATPTSAGSPTPVPTATATSGGIAAHGALFVADSSDNRVVAFLPPFSNGQDVALAIGAPDLSSSGPGGDTQSTLMFPTAIAVDPAGNLWVADSNNNRVLRFPTPFTTGMNADLVLGQSNFTSSTAALSQNGLSDPLGIAVDSAGDVFVADSSNTRILEFQPPFSNGMNAAVVIGQPNFTTANPITSQSGLNEPVSIFIDASGNLWVADDRNQRVLEFQPPFTNGMNAKLVLGQLDFVTANAPAPAQNSLAGPEGVTVDVSNNAFVADTNNNRVLEFKPPLSNGVNASVVIGQASFTTSSVGTTQNKLSIPRFQLALDASGNLWVVDNDNSRVLEFTPPFTNGMNASVVLGAPDFTTPGGSGGINGLSTPFGVAFKP